MSATTTRPAAERTDPTLQAHPGAPVPRSLTVPGVLLPTLAVWFAVMLSSMCLGTLYAESGWIGATLLTVTAVVAVGGAATWLRVPMVLVPVLCAVAMFAALTLRFVTDAPWGLVPSPYALGELRDLLAVGTTDIGRFAPPVPVTEGLIAVTALGVGSVALVVFVLQVVLRLPALAGLPLVAMYVVPSAVLTGGAPWWAFVCVVAGWLMLLVSDERLTLISWGKLLRRSDGVGGAAALSGLSSSAFRLGTVAVAVALVLPIVIPGLADAVIGRNVSGGGSGEGDGGGGEPASIGLDPIVGLQRNLLNNPDVTVLTYSTTDSTPGYLRAVVLENFDGNSWKPRPFSADSGANPLADGVYSLDGLPAAVPRQEYRYTLAADKLDSRFLPLPEEPVQVGLEGDWFVDQATSTVFGADESTTTAGRRWTVESVEVSPTPAQLAGGSPARRPGPRSGAGVDRHPRIACRDRPPGDPGRGHRLRLRAGAREVVPGRVHLQHRRAVGLVRLVPRAVPARPDRLLRAVLRHDGADGHLAGHPLARRRRLHPRHRRAGPGRRVAGLGQERARLARALLLRYRLGALRADTSDRRRRHHDPGLHRPGGGRPHPVAHLELHGTPGRQPRRAGPGRPPQRQGHRRRPPRCRCEPPGRLVAGVGVRRARRPRRCSRP